MLDFNHESLRPADDPRAEPPRDRINHLIDAALMKKRRETPSRTYLGASSLGDECDRKVQLDYIEANELNPPQPNNPEPFSGQTLRIFATGHVFEPMVRDWLRSAGFEIVDRANGRDIGYSHLDGKLKGHVDGVIHNGPLPTPYPCLWECKSLNEKNWQDVVKKGVQISKPIYAAQIALYQAYLDLTNPCLFTAINKNTQELHHELVPFNQKLAQDTSDKAVSIVKATKAGQLMPRAFASSSHFKCKWCRWSDFCWSHRGT